MISMHDGLVLYTTPSISTALGYLKDAWIGHSFIDYVHPKDKTILADQITGGIASPLEEGSKGIYSRKILEIIGIWHTSLYLCFIKIIFIFIIKIVLPLYPIIIAMIIIIYFEQMSIPVGSLLFQTSTAEGRVCSAVYEGSPDATWRTDTVSTLGRNCICLFTCSFRSGTFGTFETERPSNNPATVLCSSW